MMKGAEKDSGQKERPAAPVPGGKGDRGRLAALSLAALGVVFGDIATSPLYAIRECFHGDYAVAATPENLLGVVSLMFWALILIVTIKYLTFILKADNHGEGGVMALASLIRSTAPEMKGGGWLLAAAGLFGASLLYGDGMITPAISVLSALEGLKLITPRFDPFIIPGAVIILAGLFLLQRRGTAKVGSLFGPAIFVWLLVLAALGLASVIKHPQILAAVSPWWAVDFIVRNGWTGFLVLGAVFLVVTGAEALYADLGHFGRRPIRLVWLALVLPALLFNYFGQAAFLLAEPGETSHPFYSLVPEWGVIPMIVLATAATIIASQAVISGAFSLTRQAIQLGCLPRLRIIHTSASQIGQIYLPSVNWILMIATICLVLGFRSSGKLAAAYGVAVTSTMVISTVLFYVVARTRWKWRRWAALLPCGVFLFVDLTFFSANLGKILHGAWFPLVIGAVVFFMMTTWEKGRRILAEESGAGAPTIEEFLEKIEAEPPQRVNGQAVFLTGHLAAAPPALLHNLAHNKILHSEIALLHFQTLPVPRVPNDRKVEVERLGAGFFRITARFGYMEHPNIANTFSLAREKGLDFNMENVNFFLGRERLLPGDGNRMSRWRSQLFIFMSRNAQEAATYFDIPAGQVMEVGVQLKI